MPKLHVLLKKEELDPERLHDKVVIVLDILFATTTIVHCFSQGIQQIWPARDAEHAQAIAAGIGNVALAGEYLARTIPGFLAPTPLALIRTMPPHRGLVYATTNGTVALNLARNGARVYVGALLNAAALVAHIARHHPDMGVLLVCSGSVDRFNLEDFYGAGHFAAHFAKHGQYQLSDAARAAKLVAHNSDAATVLGESLVGTKMIAHGLQDEVDCAARRDVTPVVIEFQQDCLRLVNI